MFLSLLNGEFSRDFYRFSLRFILHFNITLRPNDRSAFLRLPWGRKKKENICSVWIISPFPLKWEINFNMIIFRFSKNRRRGSFEYTHVKREWEEFQGNFLNNFLLLSCTFCVNLTAKCKLKFMLIVRIWKWQLQMKPSHATKFYFEA